jgi:hypothetical protein
LRTAGVKGFAGAKSDTGVVQEELMSHG